MRGKINEYRLEQLFNYVRMKIAETDDGGERR